jgi:CG-1 domain/Ankyrin repeats (3 copies)
LWYCDNVPTVPGTGNQYQAGLVTLLRFLFREFFFVSFLFSSGFHVFKHRKGTDNNHNTIGTAPHIFIFKFVHVCIHSYAANGACVYVELNGPVLSVMNSQESVLQSQLPPFAASARVRATKQQTQLSQTRYAIHNTVSSTQYINTTTPPPPPPPPPPPLPAAATTTTTTMTPADDPTTDSEAAAASSSLQFRISTVLQQATVRWLKKEEALDILMNYERYGFVPNATAPSKPPSGSVFLVDRSKMKRWRKDGHDWKHKTDRHVFLKKKGKRVLECFYAHHMYNPRFQRRAYFRVDGHPIVLVHYLSSHSNHHGVKTPTPTVSANASEASSQLAQKPNHEPVVLGTPSVAASNSQIDTTDLKMEQQQSHHTRMQNDTSMNTFPFSARPRASPVIPVQSASGRDALSQPKRMLSLQTICPVTGPSVGGTRVLLVIEWASLMPAIATSQISLVCIFDTLEITPIRIADNVLAIDTPVQAGDTLVHVFVRSADQSFTSNEVTFHYNIEPDVTQLHSGLHQRQHQPHQRHRSRASPSSRIPQQTPGRSWMSDVSNFDSFHSPSPTAPSSTNASAPPLSSSPDMLNVSHTSIATEDDSIADEEVDAQTHSLLAQLRSHEQVFALGLLHLQQQLHTMVNRHIPLAEFHVTLTDLYDLVQSGRGGDDLLESILVQCISHIAQACNVSTSGGVVSNAAAAQTPEPHVSSIGPSAPASRSACASASTSTSTPASVSASASLMPDVSPGPAGLDSMRRLLRDAVQLCDHTGRTPLHYSAGLGFSRLAPFLVLFGANINAQDNAMQTPLHLAVASGDQVMIAALMAFGANPDIVDANGNRAAHIGDAATSVLFRDIESAERVIPFSEERFDGLTTEEKQRERAAYRQIMDSNVNVHSMDIQHMSGKPCGSALASGGTLRVNNHGTQRDHSVQPRIHLTSSNATGSGDPHGMVFMTPEYHASNDLLSDGMLSAGATSNNSPSAARTPDSSMATLPLRTLGQDGSGDVDSRTDRVVFPFLDTAQHGSSPGAGDLLHASSFHVSPILPESPLSMGLVPSRSREHLLGPKQNDDASPSASSAGADESCLQQSFENMTLRDMGINVSAIDDPNLSRDSFSRQVSMIQRRIRWWLTKRHEAAKKLQAHARGMLVRKHARQLRSSVRFIQSIVRKRRAQREFQVLRRTALTLQQNFRRRSQRKRAKIDQVYVIDSAAVQSPTSGATTSSTITSDPKPTAAETFADHVMQEER